MSVRFARREDIPAILEIYGPYVANTAFSFEYTIPTLEDFITRFEKITAWFPWLVWEENGKILGYAYGSAPFERAAYQWCAESSIYLAPDVRGRGIGRKLNTALEELLAKQGYHKVYAIVTTANEGSVAFHEKLGYTYHSVFENCGYKMGRWLGVIWLQKWLNPLDQPTAFPKKWTEVV